MTTKKLVNIIAVALVVVALIATPIVLASTQHDDEDVRKIPATQATETVETLDKDTVETLDKDTVDNTTITTENEDTNDSTIETDGTIPSNDSTTTTATPNYAPTQNISGQADVVDSNDAPVVTVVVEKDTTTDYKDEDVSAVIIPTVVTPGTTFGVETTPSTTPTTDTVRTDIVVSPAMDNDTVEEDVVGVELEEVQDEEMPDFLP